MPEWEQKLTQKYSPIIAEGEHVVSTQLRQVIGMRNAFEKITAIVDTTNPSPKLEIIHTSKHAGSIASFSKDKDSCQKIADLNARQAQEWIGSDRRLHCNTFNSGPTLGLKVDRVIVKQTLQAMANVGGKETNSAFNPFRLSERANVYDGVKDVIKELSKALEKNKEFETIKTHLNPEPRGWVSKLFGINKPKGDATEEIKKLKDKGLIGEATEKILKTAIDLTNLIKDTGKASLDLENIQLSLSQKLNELATTTANLTKSEDVKGLMLSKIVKEEILNMCASGKDRTGIGEHDQSVQALAIRLGGDVGDLDSKLLAAGHTAGQTGGAYAGGASIGCYGTKAETAQCFPRSRNEGLATIIEVASKGNNIEAPSKFFTELNQKETERELILAIASNNLDAIKKIASRSKSLDFHFNGRDYSPLTMAMSLGKTEIAKALIAAGAKADFKDKAGKIPDYHKNLYEQGIKEKEQVLIKKKVEELGHNIPPIHIESHLHGDKHQSNTRTNSHTMSM